jgi:hypothetical protein
VRERVCVCECMCMCDCSQPLASGHALATKSCPLTPLLTPLPSFPSCPLRSTLPAAPPLPGSRPAPLLSLCPSPFHSSSHVPLPSLSPPPPPLRSTPPAAPPLPGSQHREWPEAPACSPWARRTTRAARSFSARVLNPRGAPIGTPGEALLGGGEWGAASDKCREHEPNSAT